MGQRKPSASASAEITLRTIRHASGALFVTLTDADRTGRRERMTTDDDDTPLTPAQEQATLDAIDAAWVASPEAIERVRQLFLAKLAAKYPGHPWLSLPEPSQGARDFLVARQDDAQFWRLLAALRDGEASEKGGK